jgi:hypothetical protein
MLPTPFLDHIPKDYRDDADSATTALCDKMDTILDEFLQSVFMELKFADSAAAPTGALDELGYMLGAGIVFGDSSTVKRQKIYSAVKSGKSRSLWTASMKAKIDLVTGHSSALWGWKSLYAWVEPAGTTTELTDTYKWASFGTNGTDGLGIWEIGTFLEPAIQGNIFIDLAYAASPADIVLIKNAIADDVPAYMIIHLGWVTAGFFVELGVME